MAVKANGGRPRVGGSCGLRRRVRVMGDAARSVAEALEQRALLSNVQVLGGSSIQAEPQAVETYDVGEQSWRATDTQPLLRVAGEVAVGLAPGASKAHVLGELANSGGLLSDLVDGSILDSASFTLLAKLPDSRDVPTAENEGLLSALGHMDGVAWAVPVYLDRELGLKEIVTDEVIVALGSVSIQGIVGPDVISWHHLTGSTNQYVLKLDERGPDALAAIRRYAALPGVQWAEPNAYVQVREDSAPNDAYYSYEWNMPNASVPAAWDLLSAAHPGQKPGNGVVIAIMDDGVDLSHLDLSIWQNPGQPTGSTGDDDNNSYPGDVHGWDFLDGTSDPSPSTAGANHGTAVAGVAAAVGNNNGRGVAGVAYGSSVMPLKIADTDNPTVDHYATPEHLADAIYYAAGLDSNGAPSWHGADVLNFSWGWPSYEVVTQAFATAATKGAGASGCRSLSRPAISRAGICERN